jgi:anti-repressor protein
MHANNTLFSLNSKTELTMSSREIAELVESRHDSVKRTIERLTEKKLVSFTPSVETSHSGPGARNVEVYLVNKRDSYVIVAQLSPEFTARLVDRWQELESAINPVQKYQIPETYAAALRLAADTQEALDAAQKQIEADKPKVDFANIVTASDNTRCVRVWVKTMKSEDGLTVGEREVFKWLVDNRYIFRDGTGYLPYARYEAGGLNYFEAKPEVINGKARRVLRITGKGVVALTGKVVRHFCEIDLGVAVY